MIRITLSALCLLLAAAATTASCLPGELCLDTTLPRAPIPCYPGYLCPGNDTARACPAGSFCPTSTRIEPCPSGSFCPPLTVTPKECSPFATCPTGSSRYFFVGGIFLVLIPFAALAVYKKLVLDAANSTERAESDRAAAADTTRRSVARPNDALAPFSDSGATKRALAKMTDKQAVAAASGAVAVSVDGSLALAGVRAVSNPVTLRFEKLVTTVEVEGKPKTIMQSVSGTFKAGRVSAVCGPSGAGKTTLFRILLGKLPVSSGTVLLNEEPSSLQVLRGRVGFVPQNDVMITTFSVRDVLVHAARTRLPDSMSDAQKVERAEQVMQALSLTRIQHSIIGDAASGERGISGGERKRVSIGLELVAAPSVLLLDEPTTGLDSTTALDVVRLLKGIAHSGRVCIIAVIHQPRSLIFDMFDDLLLLAPGGRTVYSGPTSKTLGYFTAHGYPCPPKANPSDHFIDVVSGAIAVRGTGAEMSDSEKAVASEVQNKLVALWATEEKSLTRSLVPPTPQSTRASTVQLKADAASAGAGWWQQFLFNLYRALLQQVKGAQFNVTVFEMCAQLFCGLIVGLAFVDDNWFLPPLPAEYAKYCPLALKTVCESTAQRDLTPLETALISMILGVISAVTGVRTFGSEILNASREIASGQSTSAYFLAKLLADIPNQIVYSLIFVSTYYVVAAPNATFGDYFLLIFIYQFVVYSIGYVCSMMFKAQENALLMGVVAALLSGLGTDNETIIKSLCWTRWSGEAMFLIQVRANELEGATRTIYQTYADFKVKFDLDNFALDIGVLVIFGVALRVLTLVLLRRRQRAIEESS